MDSLKEKGWNLGYRELFWKWYKNGDKAESREIKEPKSVNGAKQNLFFIYLTFLVLIKTLWHVNSKIYLKIDLILT